MIKLICCAWCRLFKQYYIGFFDELSKGKKIKYNGFYTANWYLCVLNLLKLNTSIFVTFYKWIIVIICSLTHIFLTFFIIYFLFLNNFFFVVLRNHSSCKKHKEKNIYKFFFPSHHFTNGNAVTRRPMYKKK